MDRPYPLAQDSTSDEIPLNSIQALESDSPWMAYTQTGHIDATYAAEQVSVNTPLNGLVYYREQPGFVLHGQYYDSSNERYQFDRYDDYHNPYTTALPDSTHSLYNNSVPLNDHRWTQDSQGHPFDGPRVEQLPQSYITNSSYRHHNYPYESSDSLSDEYRASIARYSNAFHASAVQQLNGNGDIFQYARSYDPAPSASLHCSGATVPFTNDIQGHVMTVPSQSASSLDSQTSPVDHDKKSDGSQSPAHGQLKFVHEQPPLDDSPLALVYAPSMSSPFRRDAPGSEYESESTERGSVDPRPTSTPPAEKKVRRRKPLSPPRVPPKQKPKARVRSLHPRPEELDERLSPKHAFPTWPGASQSVIRLNATKKSSEKKQPLACLFCRERKIACGRPDAGSEDPTCNQCARRHLSCVYPKESRRGQHKRTRRKIVEASDGTATPVQSTEVQATVKT